MRLRTLGGLTLEGASLSRPKPLLLLTYLTLEGVRERRFLADLFWMNATNPRNSLATALAHLRRGGASVIETDGTRAWAHVECDAVELLALVERGSLLEAVALYRGPFLSGVALGESGMELEEWVYGTREFIANRIRHARIELAQRAAGRAEFGRAAELAERAYRVAEAGEPEPEQLTRIFTLLVAGSSPTAGEVRREAASFGIALEMEERDARSLLAAHSDSGLDGAAKLPAIGTSFVGRRAELVELARHLSGQGVRLLTLVGSGGVGKSRLALQLAQHLSETGRFPHGVVFTPLEALSNPAMIPVGIATGLGLMLRGSEDPLSQVARHIGDRRMLLLLDNFEHLVAGAARVPVLLRACPNLAVLATSRERLNLAEEFVFPVEGLVGSASDADLPEVHYRDAVELFHQRAKSADLRFSLTPEVFPQVLRICQLVGGSPLGIELAAAWVRLMPPEAIAEEIGRDLDFLTSPLRDIGERHRNLRAVFDHSWNLLTVPEQDVLKRLSVFRGGFRREPAAAVSEASIPVLASLTDKSLLSMLRSGRYDRHPLVFRYTAEKLSADPDEEARIRERHGRHFLSLVEQSEGLHRTLADESWLARIDEEIDNIRAALTWIDETEQAELALRLAGSLWWYWRVRGHAHEGLDRLRTALARPAAAERTAARARALTVTSNLVNRLGDLRSAQRLSEESLGIWRELDDDRGLARALLVHGNNTYRLGDPQTACTLIEEGVRRARRANDVRHLPQLLGHLFVLRYELGELKRARRLADEVLEMVRATDNWYMAIRTNGSFGQVAMIEGHNDLARSRFEAALAHCHEGGDTEFVPQILLLQSELAYRTSDFPAARTLCEQSLRLFRELANVQGVSRVFCTLGDLLLVQGEVSAALDCFEESRAIGSKMGWSAGVAEARIGLGEAHLAALDLPGARSLLDQGLATVQHQGLKALEARAVRGLGAVDLCEGDAAAARRSFETGRVISSEIEDRRGTALALHGLGLALWAQNDPTAATSYLRQSLELYGTLGDRRGVAMALESLASLPLPGAPQRAARLVGAAEAIRSSIGAPLLDHERERYDSTIASIRAAAGEAIFSSARLEGRKLSLAEGFALALAGNDSGIEA